MLSSESLSATRTLTPVQQGARRVIFRQLRQIQHGKVVIIEHFAGQDAERVHEFGNNSTPSACIEVLDPQLYVRLIKGGSIAGAEAYIDGLWESNDLTAVTHVMALNQDALDGIENRVGWLAQWAEKAGHWLRRNTPANSKKNISAHYDIGNDLYRCFLDKEMLYSAAVFGEPDMTLEQAQMNKMTRLCEQLQLKPEDSVIEIGTGWGAMAIFMARHYGCHVTTTTISDEQFDYTKQRIEREGLQDRITLLKRDYRLLEGQFDKLVSIEMIEAVGKRFLPSFVTKCNELVKPGGLMAIQAITIADQRFESYSRGVDFIQKYIFPGGFLPSVNFLLDNTTLHSQWVLHDLKDIGLDYAKTLSEWRRRFHQAKDELVRLGCDTGFLRMWHFYFCYCEGGFLGRSISTVHLTFRKP